MEFTQELAYSLWAPRSGEKTDPTTKLNTVPKLLMLHGLGGSGALWRPIAASLEDRYEILAVDQRGHGKSQVTDPQMSLSATYAPLDYGRDTVATLDRLKFHPAWIVGHSMGVRSACATAHLKPEWVQGMVLVDLGFAGPAGGGLGEGLAQFLKVLPMTFPSRTEARAFMDKNCPDPSIGQYLLAVSVPTSGGGLAFPFDREALIKTIEATRDFSVRPWVRELGKRGMPILVLRGANSLVWTHEDFESERAQFSEFKSIIFEEFPGTGHGLPFEKRLDFVARIEKFMGETKT
jgi:pimeloyl-ACP methyl ester carboxylesterase